MNKLQTHWLGQLDYQQAWDLQKDLVKKVATEEIPHQLLLLEHSPTYTFGRKATLDNLLFSEEQLEQEGINVFWVDRGGDVTYHGPGQLIGYPILNLKKYQTDWPNPSKYLRMVEQVILDFLASYQIEGWRYEKYTGVWVNQPPIHAPTEPDEPHKIAAIGAKFHGSGVSSHGFAINLQPNLNHFKGIIPCGIEEHEVTSIKALIGKTVPMEQAAEQIAEQFATRFELNRYK